MHIILSRYIQIWHFYRTLSRGLLFSWTQCRTLITSAGSTSGALNWAWSAELHLQLMRSAVDAASSQNAAANCWSGPLWHHHRHVTALHTLTLWKPGRMIAPVHMSMSVVLFCTYIICVSLILKLLAVFSTPYSLTRAFFVYSMSTVTWYYWQLRLTDPFQVCGENLALC